MRKEGKKHKKMDVIKYLLKANKSKNWTKFFTKHSLQLNLTLTEPRPTVGHLALGSSGFLLCLPALSRGSFPRGLRPSHLHSLSSLALETSEKCCRFLAAESQEWRVLRNQQVFISYKNPSALVSLASVELL